MILETEPNTPEGFYLQELIKVNFVNPIKKNYSIPMNIINEIRNYTVICGWSKNQNIVEQKDCCKFYIFLSDLLNIPKIEFEIFRIKDNIIANNSQILKTQVINLQITKDDNVRNLFYNWINSNITSELNNGIQFNCYKLINIPNYIIFNINRFNQEGERNNYKLDIMKHIKFFGINDQSQSYLKWKIHSIICYNGTTQKNGHYYTILLINKQEWIIFDDLQIPSFNSINLEDDNVKEKIMLESVMLLYTLEY